MGVLNNIMITADGLAAPRPPITAIGWRYQLGTPALRASGLSARRLHEHSPSGARPSPAFPEKDHEHDRGLSASGMLGMMRVRHWHRRVIQFGKRRQAAKEAVRLVLHSCRKVDLVRIAAGSACAGNKRPEITDGDRGAVGAKQLAQEMVVLRIEDIDRAVTKIPDQKIVGEFAKSRRCD